MTCTLFVCTFLHDKLLHDILCFQALIADKKYLKKGGIIVSNPLLNMVDDEDEENYFDDEEEYSEDFDSDVSCD